MSHFAAKQRNLERFKHVLNHQQTKICSRRSGFKVHPHSIRQCRTPGCGNTEDRSDHCPQRRADHRCPGWCGGVHAAQGLHWPSKAALGPRALDSLSHLQVSELRSVKNLVGVLAAGCAVLWVQLEKGSERNLGSCTGKSVPSGRDPSPLVHCCAPAMRTWHKMGT